MKASISKSMVKGRVSAPSSKSYTIRGLMCAAMAEGESEIVRPLGSDDTEAAWDVLGKIGVRIERKGASWLVDGGNFQAPGSDLYCRESAATLRFMTALSAVVPGRCRLTAAPSLAARPVRPLVDALRQMGIDCSYDEKEAAVTVNGDVFRGGRAGIPGDISSQYVSALLMLSPFAEEGMRIELTAPLKSRSFVLMTLECFRDFGIEIDCSGDLREFNTSRQRYRPAVYNVEGDWTSASYLLAMGALCGDIEVDNLNPESLQGDRVMLDILRNMGAEITVANGVINVKKSELNAIEVDLDECIDLLPTVAVLAAAAEGTSVLTGIGRARLKESDRISAVAEGLRKMNIDVREEPDRLVITGGVPGSAVIDTRGDHRIAMAFSLPGMIAGNTVIENAECVSKTYPEYWHMLQRIGGEVDINV